MMPSHEPKGLLGQIRHIPLSYENENGDSSARQLVLALRPDWSSPDSNIGFVRFTEGITNTLLKAVNRREGITTEEIDNEAILLRAYGHGTDVLIDRHRETQNHELLMKHHLAPELLARFDNGMMYRFVRGNPTKPADLRIPSIYLAVARRLAQWHATVPCIHDTAAQSNGVDGEIDGRHKAATDNVAPGKPPPNVWTVMQKWIVNLPIKTEAQRKRQAVLEKELLRLVEDLSQRPSLGENGLVFAHCDLLSGNVIVEPQGSGTAGGDNGESQQSVTFIDYEYAVPSPAAFDLANHFAEWGGFECNYSVLPTRAQRLDFIREYVRIYSSLVSSRQRPLGEDDETKALRLLEEVDMYRGVPGFYWGIWALIQATISHIDFDYAMYAETRLGEYWAWRAAAIGDREREGKELPPRERRWAQLE